MDTEAFRTRLAALRAKYIASLPGRLAEIRRGFEAQRSSPDPEGWVVLHRQAHTLIGSAGTFGLDDISDAARALEIPLRTLIEDVNAVPDFPLLFALLHDLTTLADEVNN